MGREQQEIFSFYFLFNTKKKLAVVGGGRNEHHTVFRRCAAPEKIRIVRTEGSNSGELKREKKTKKVTK